MANAHIGQKDGIIIKGNFYPINWFPEVIEMIADATLEKLKLQDSEPIKPNEEIFYTVHEVAVMLRKSDATVTRHIRRKLLIGSKTGKSWLISRDNLLAYQNAGNSALY